MDPSFKLSEHVSNVFMSASRISNLIFRLFVISRPDFYRQLYVSLIIPRLLYCSQIWSPRLKKDIDLLEKVRTRFERRVAARCSIPRESFVLDSVAKLHETADERLFNKLLMNGNASRFFVLTPRVRGNGLNVNPLQVARSEAVAGTFSWRFARRLHGFLGL